MEALVIGATGHIGNNLVTLLLRKGWKVRVLVRANNNTLPFKNDNLSYVIGDTTNYSSLLNAIKKDDIVFDLAAKISIYKNDKSLYKINYEGAKNVVDVCIEKKVKKLIHISTCHIIDPVPGVLTEPRETIDPKTLVGDYVKTKAMAWNYVCEKAKEGELNAVIVMPTGVIGPSDIKVSNIGQAIISVANKKIPCGITGGYNFVDVRDVCGVIYNAFLYGKTGESYLAANKLVKATELLNITSNLCGYNKKFKSIDWHLVYPFLIFAEWNYRLKHKVPLFTRYSLLTLNTNANFSNKKSIEELKVKYQYSIEQSLKDTLIWFLKNKKQLFKPKIYEKLIKHFAIKEI